MENFYFGTVDDDTLRSLGVGDFDLSLYKNTVDEFVPWFYEFTKDLKYVGGVHWLNGLVNMDLYETQLGAIKSILYERLSVDDLIPKVQYGMFYKMRYETVDVVLMETLSHDERKWRYDNRTNSLCVDMLNRSLQKVWTNTNIPLIERAWNVDTLYVGKFCSSFSEIFQRVRHMLYMTILRDETFTLDEKTIEEIFDSILQECLYDGKDDDIINVIINSTSLDPRVVVHHFQNIDTIN